MSRYSSRREWEGACWKKILKSEKFLELLIAPYERRHIIRRAAVMDYLNSGKRFGEISEELGLSPQTISSIKKAAQNHNYRSYRERGKTERKKKLYSADISPKKRKPEGRPVRTKYGTVYLSH